MTISGLRTGSHLSLHGIWIRRSGIAIAILGAALVMTLVGSGPASAARPDRAAIQILKPHPGTALVTAGRPLVVRVRVAPGVRKLRAMVLSGGRQRIVTKRFGGARHGVRTASLRIGPELARGAGAIWVSGRRGGDRSAASAHFFVVDRKAEMLRVKGLPRHTAARPLKVRLKTTDRVDDVRVRVNGGPARDVFTSTAGGDWRGVLSPDEGLRFGRNRIVITAIDLDGAFERDERIVRVRRGRPFVAAGKDRRTTAHQALRLNGQKSLPRPNERLRFSWRIVHRPHGSKARLRRPHSLRPSLRPDRPGIYRVRLVAQPRRARAGAAASATASAVPGEATPSAGPGSSGADTVSVAAQPAVTPQGVPVQTVGAVDGEAGGPGIKVGPSWHPMAAGGAVQMVTLDGATLEMTRDYTYDGTEAGMLELLNAVENTPTTSTVLLQHPSSRGELGYDELGQNGVGFLSEALGRLGAGEDVATGRWAGLPLGGWSVVSATDGRTAHVMAGLSPQPDRPEGEITGYLQSAGGEGGEPGATHLFSWPSTFLTFDTQSGGENWLVNEMTIAGSTYRSASIPENTAGFHLVWLDAGTLALRGEATILDSEPQKLSQTLGEVSGTSTVADPALLFLTTIGHPNIPRPTEGEKNGLSETGAQWAKVAGQIASFGGNQSAFLSLRGSMTSQYSLAGATEIGNQAPDAGVDVSRELEPLVPAPRLVGVLERRPGGAWGVGTGGAPSGPDDVAALLPELTQVLAQPAQPFQPFQGPGEKAAERYIGERLGLSTSDPEYGIRANYWSLKEENWETMANRLMNPRVVPPCSTEPCRKAFGKVQEQLEVEFEANYEVRGYFARLEKQLRNQYIEGSFDFSGISSRIVSKYPPKAPTAQGDSPFDIIEGVLDAASELVPEGGAALGVAGAAVEIASGFTSSESGGSSYLGVTAFEAEASQFADALATDFRKSLAGLWQIGNLLVSDAGRLEVSAREARKGWAVNLDTLEKALSRSMASYLWSGLLPTTYKAYQCIVPPVYFPPENFRPAPWYPVSITTPDELQFSQYTGVTSYPPKWPEGWGVNEEATGAQIGDGFLTVGRDYEGEQQYLEAGDAANLFGPVDAADVEKLGLIPAYFLAPQPKANTPGFELEPGAFDENQENGYVRFSCVNGENTWHEDTNERAQ